MYELKGSCTKDNEPRVRVRGWNSTRGNSTPVHRVQRSAHIIVYPISPMHHWAEHIKKWFMSSAPMDMHAGCFLKQLLVPPCVSNMIPKKKKLSSCTTEDLAPYMYIPKGMKKCRQLSFSLSYFKWCNEEQSNTKPYFYSHHQSIFHICLFWTVEWYLRKHTHTHTSIIVFTYCCVHLTFKGIVHPIIIYSPSSCPKFLSSAKHRRR